MSPDDTTDPQKEPLSDEDLEAVAGGLSGPEAGSVGEAGSLGPGEAI